MSAADLVATLRSINDSSFSSVEQQQIIQEADALVSRLETPFEMSCRLNVSYPATLACVQIALDLKLFESWLAEKDGKPCSAKELQELVPQCDRILFIRLLRRLEAQSRTRRLTVYNDTIHQWSGQE